jgi:hypothetical protein
MQLANNFFKNKLFILINFLGSSTHIHKTNFTKTQKKKNQPDSYRLRDQQIRPHKHTPPNPTTKKLA